MYNFNFVDLPLLDYTKYAASINCYSKRELKVEYIDDCVVLPKRESTKTIICLDDFLKNQSNITDDLQYNVQSVIYLGNWYNVWGHLLTDSLSKIWVVYSDFFKNMNLSTYNFVICIDKTPLPNQFYELLELIGIDRSKLMIIEKPTCFKKIYIPDDSIFVKEDAFIAEKDADKKGGLYFYTDEYKSLIELIKSKIDLNTKYDKVFFSVKTSNKFFGINLIEKKIKNAGFIVVDPSELTLKNQLSMLFNCNVFCTIEGSISFNSLFLKNNAEVVLIRKLPYIVPYQFMINQISNLSVTYVDSHLSLLCDKNYPYLGPFFMYPNENLKKYLQRYGYNFEVKFPLALFLNYVISAFRLHSKHKVFIRLMHWEVEMYYLELFENYIKSNFLLRKLFVVINKINK